MNSLEHILPDSLFACPKKSADDNHTALSTAPVEANENPSTPSSNNNQLLPSASPLTMATMKNVFAKCPGKQIRKNERFVQNDLFFFIVTFFYIIFSGFLLGMECS